MKNFLVSVLFLLAISASAQTYHPLIRPDTYWDVMKVNFRVPPCNYESGNRFFFQGDSTINGVQYNILQAYNIISLVPPYYCHPYAVDGSVFYPFAYMREDTVLKKVFIYDTWFNTESLQYDFSVNVGDTLDSLYGPWTPPQVIITSIDTVVLNNGQLRKRFNGINMWGILGELFIESLGGNQGIGFPLFSPVFDFYYEPGCIIENNVTLYGSVMGNPCLGFVGLTENNPINPVFSIAYNPTSHSATLTTPSLKGKTYLLRVFDLMGKVVFKEEGTLSPGYFSRDLKMDGLASGVYVVCVLTEEMGLVGKVAK